MKKKKFFTIWIVTDESAPPVIFSLEKSKLKKILIGLVVVLFIGAALLVDYINLSMRRDEFKRLQEENLSLKKRVAVLEHAAFEIDKQLKMFKNYVKKLNTIAGLESPYALREVGGIGGESAADVSEVQAQLYTETDKINSVIDRYKKLSKRAKGLEINFETLYRFFKEQQDLLAATPSIWPTRGYITSVFGYRRDPFTGKRAFHEGIDISTQFGQKVHATADGIVVKTAYSKRGYGYYVIIDHSFGFSTLYAHLSKILVKPGQKVKRWDVIGLVGSTGKSTAPHLHYEVRVYGKPVNPMLYILEDFQI